MADDYGVVLPGIGLIAHEDQIAARPDVLRKMAAVIAPAWQAMLDGRSTPSTEGKPLGWQSDEDWRQWIATSERGGVIKPGHQPSEYYTNTLLEAAK